MGEVVTREWTDRDWLVPVALLAGSEWLVSELLAWSISFPARPSFIQQFAFGARIGLAMLAGFYIWQFAKLIKNMTASPTRRLVEITRERRMRIAGVAAGLFCISLHWVAFSWTKSMLPAAVPFWADRPLADFDEALFGRAAWEWALNLVGPAAAINKLAYSLWLPLHFIVLAAALCMRPSQRKSRLLIAYFLMWIIGMILAFAVSSAGPIFYEPLGFGTRFRDLSSEPHIGGIPKTAAYLWSNYENNTALPGAGISAFPSMHVADAVWIALVIRHWSAWLFAALIFYGSFLLGWHYFLDAPAGVAVTLFAYLLAGKACDLISRRSAPPPFVEPSVEKSLADATATP